MASRRRDFLLTARFTLQNAPGVVCFCGVVAALWVFVGRGGALGPDQALVANDVTPAGCIAHQLFHTHGWHLLANVFVIAVAGGLLEATWGTFKFALFALFVAAGVTGANLLAGQLVLAGWFGPGGPTQNFGGSGLAFACLVGMAVALPRTSIGRLLSVRSLVWALIFLGATGLALHDLAHGTRSVSSAPRVLTIPQLAGVGLGLFFFWACPRVESGVASARRVQERRRRERLRAMRLRVDDLLDKISLAGYANLTGHEKRFLRAASRHYKSTPS